MDVDKLGRRQAEPGELCGCGRPAVVVYIGGYYGDTGDCLMGDAGTGGPTPCPFCDGAIDHAGGACPWYRLTLDGPIDPKRYEEGYETPGGGFARPVGPPPWLDASGPV